MSPDEKPEASDVRLFRDGVLIILRGWRSRQLHPMRGTGSAVDHLHSFLSSKDSIAI